jgi:hypothetical protein
VCLKALNMLKHRHYIVNKFTNQSILLPSTKFLPIHTLLYVLLKLFEKYFYPLFTFILTFYVQAKATNKFGS